VVVVVVVVVVWWYRCLTTALNCPAEEEPVDYGLLTVELHYSLAYCKCC